MGYQYPVLLEDAEVKIETAARSELTPRMAGPPAVSQSTRGRAPARLFLVRPPGDTKKRGGPVGPPLQRHQLERMEVGPVAHLARPRYLKNVMILSIIL